MSVLITRRKIFSAVHDRNWTKRRGSCSKEAKKLIKVTKRQFCVSILFATVGVKISLIAGGF